MNAKTYADSLGITYRQFDHWCRTGYVFDDLESAMPGYGYSRSLTQSEAERLRLMAGLVTLGLRPKPAAALARELHAKGKAKAGGLLLTVAEEAA